MGKWVAGGLVVTSLVVAAAFSLVAAVRDLTALETVLLQIFMLGAGLTGSFLFGRESAQQAARDLVKPHARSAFRRLLSLYRSLSRLAVAIQSARTAGTQNPLHAAVLDKLEALVIEQITTADDALEDWKDIVPEDLAELRRLAEKQRAEENP